MTDRVLLQRFVEANDQAAFAELVRRHGPWIHSSARRQLHDPHLAEDVMQAVFVLLARKARKLLKHPNIPGWLFMAMGYAVRAQQRTIARQRRREARAMESRPAALAPDADWDRLAPELDPAVARLGEADRQAILLRYYQGLSVVQCAAEMKVSEEAAKKRLQRALDRLRGHLTASGITISPASLALVLTQQTNQVVSPMVIQSAIAAATVSAPTRVAVLATLASKTWAFATAKVAAIVVTSVVAILALPIVAVLPTTKPAAHRRRDQARRYAGRPRHSRSTDT